MLTTLHNKQSKRDQTHSATPLYIKRRDEFGGINLPALSAIGKVLGAQEPTVKISKQASLEDKVTYWGMGAYQRLINVLSIAVLGTTAAMLPIAGILGVQGNAPQAFGLLGITAFFGATGAILVFVAHAIRRYRGRVATYSPNREGTVHKNGAGSHFNQLN